MMDHIDDIKNTNGSSGSKPVEFDCADVAAVLSGLVDDELPVETRHLAERHMSGCDACRTLIDDAESLNEVLGRSIDLVPSLPAGFEEAVLAETTRLPIRRAVGGWRVAGGWIAAAAALGLAATVWFVRPDDGAGRQTASNDRGTGSSVTSGGGGEGGEARPQNRPPLSAVGGDRDRTVAAASPAPQKSRTYYLPGFEAVSVTNDGYVPAITRTSLGSNGAASSGVAADQDGTHPAFRVFEDAHDNAVRRLPEQLSMGAPINQQAPEVAALSWSDEYALAQAASLLEMLFYDDQQSFSTVEHIRRTIEYDELLPRLEQARTRLPVADRLTLLAAESVLYRIVHGPVSQPDLREMRQTVGSFRLVDKVEAMSGSGNPDRAM